MIFFSFFQEANTKVSLLFLLFYSSLEISALSRKNVFLSPERFIIVLWRSFVINPPLVCSKIFLFHLACLFKISVKILRKWYSILLRWGVILSWRWLYEHPRSHFLLLKFVSIKNLPNDSSNATFLYVQKVYPLWYIAKSLPL